MRNHRTTRYFLLLTSLVLLASLLLSHNTSMALAFKQPLPIDQAFQFSAQVKNTHLILAKWKLAPGYHLYRERIKFAAKQSHIKLGKVILPPGIAKEDNILGKYQIYENSITLQVPVITDTNKITLLAHYQGCADDGFCYPPTTKAVSLVLNQGTSQAQTGNTISNNQFEKVPQSEQDKITNILRHDHLMWIILIFLGFGILLTFTPCVLPMIPIISGILVGQGDTISAYKGFVLSLIYVLGMSLTYAIIGVIAGFTGNSLQAMLQSPTIIIIFSVLFILLALSLFGFFEIRLPTRIVQNLDKINRKQQGGTYLGVFVMGILATLIVSPCVTPPLIGALSYIGQTGDAMLGGIALFSLGFGMGIPLLIIGTTGGNILPKAGSWMDTVKAVFGVLMLAVAVWMLSRVIPGAITMLLWAGLFIASAVYLGAFNNQLKNGWYKLWKALGLFAFVYGVLLVIGAATGNNDPLKPLINFPFMKASSNPNASSHLFTRIKSRQDLANAIAQAKNAHRPIILDFYASWCTSCKEMEATTFADPRVIAALKPFMLLQADVTANDRVDQDLEHSLQVIAPPTIIFFNSQGKEIKGLRIVGEMGPQHFLQHLAQVHLAMK